MSFAVQYITNKHSKLKNCVVVCDGNSLTVGQGASAGNDYPNLLSNKYPIVNFANSVTNKGVGGQTTPQMEADASTDIDSLLSGTHTNILLAWEIRNHLVVDGVTNVQAYDAFVDYCSDRQLAGWKVIVGTVLPSWQASYRGDNTITGYNQLNTDRLEINGWIRSNWSTFADGLADVALIDGLSDLGDNEQSGYTFNTSTRPTESENGLFDDGTHLTNAGYALIANCFLKAIWKHIN